MRNGNWRGTILIYPFAEQAVEIISRRLSTVAVLESYNQPGLDIIDTDDASAISSLVARLADSGHRRIGFLSWDYPVGGHWVARRFSGYVEALFNRGLPFRPEWVLNVDKNLPRLSPTQVADAVAQKIREDHVTAWVCAADHQAYQLAHDLPVRGLRVPEDCSITGFDGLDPASGQKRVTSMRVPHEQIGSAAVTRLVNRIQHPTAPRRKILVEAEFVAGESITAPSDARRPVQ
jgi:LacI family transcriptional regulator